MATTTNYGWTTPDDTALVKDGAAAIRTLGSSVDTTTKALNPSTTLGDIEYRSSTANTNTRLAIGTTGQVLSVSGGVPAWTTPSAAGGMTLINTGGTTLTGASVTISSIPSTYKNLQLVIRNFLPATDDKGIGLRYNGDSGTRYAIMFSNASSPQSFDRTQLDLGYGNDNSIANGIIVSNIYDYANTVTYKVSDTILITTNATTTNDLNYRRGVGVYNQLDAITSITFLPETGNFTSGTAFLYGAS
jgi:hypothetical protein